MDNEFKKSPFGENINWQLNACVGENGGPYKYSDYAIGYFTAGHILSEKLIKEKGWDIDVLIYPLLYCYRHALELSIKHILDSKNRIVHTHDLLKLWKEAEQILVPLIDFNSLVEISDVIKDFCTIDPVSEVPRFPKNKKGESSMQDLRIINILPIYEKMKDVEPKITNTFMFL